MRIKEIQTIFERELLKLQSEIEAYKNEQNLWIVEKQISNSGGNLCLHLIGNLNTFVGVHLGKSSYQRNRELEFSAKDLPRDELTSRVRETIALVNDTLAQLPEEKLDQDFPVIVWKDKTSISFMLMHLLSHLSYHLGQINYHRRLLDN
jgi:uncharacterized damage-inducible protein DinB